MIKGFEYHIPGYERLVESCLNELNENKIIERIRKKDFTVWSNKPDEITNRLGWLKSPGVTLAAIDEINEFVQSVIKDGFKHVLLLGMGGSSLAPEVFSLTFGHKPGYPDLAVLDSTHPETVKEYAEKYNPTDTLYIVSTKSGGTVETFSFMKYFFNQALSVAGKDNAGRHFTAITDPGSGLQKVASELNFRKIFLNDPEIGGRFSALSLFGIVPAALLGIDIRELLKRAEIMQCTSESINNKPVENNTSARLGVIIGELAKLGKDKLTFILPDELSSFGSWVEQLIAESTGKSGKGILPVVGEELLTPENYSDDRLFVSINVSHLENVKHLEEAGHPIIQITLNDIYDLGAEFFRWEMATAIAGWCLGIQPFDQPNVESAKIVARKLVDDYIKTGKLAEVKPDIEERGIKIYSEMNGKSIKEILNLFFKKFNEDKVRSYICLQAYLKTDSDTSNALQSLRTALQKKYKCATTVGYGPRFLHSTGQLHKGDAGNGLFIQFISDVNEDVQIPDNAGDSKSSISFGVLITAQVFGDRQALVDNHRKVITIDLGKKIINNIKQIESITETI